MANIFENLLGTVNGFFRLNGGNGPQLTGSTSALFLARQANGSSANFRSATPLSGSDGNVAATKAWVDALPVTVTDGEFAQQWDTDLNANSGGHYANSPATAFPAGTYIEQIQVSFAVSTTIVAGQELTIWLGSSTNSSTPPNSGNAANVAGVIPAGTYAAGASVTLEIGKIFPAVAVGETKVISWIQTDSPTSPTNTENFKIFTTYASVLTPV